MGSSAARMVCILWRNWITQQRPVHQHEEAQQMLTGTALIYRRLREHIVIQVAYMS